MKIWLIQSPVQDFYDTDIRLQPIGLAYLKAAIRKTFPDIQVVVKDYHHNHGRKTISIPKELVYLKEYYIADQSPFSTFSNYYHFGASFEIIAQELADERPDLVGISALFSPYYREALKIAELVKLTINVPVLMGGAHVSAMPEQILKSPHVDFIIRGEGEKAIVEFIKAFQTDRNYKNVPNLGYKNHDELVLNEITENNPINELAFPDFSDFTPQTYLFEKRPISFMITSRSCPHRCSFCSVHNTFGFKYRRRAVENILEEIDVRYQEGYGVIDFEDDNLTFYQEEMKVLCHELIRRYPSRDLQFVAMNGISYLSLDEELLNLMKQAGFTHLNISLVSSDTTIRETTKRPHTLQKYLEVVKRAHELGFKIVSYQILGLPGESLDSMIETLAFNAQLPVLLGASPFYLTPNCPIAKNFPLQTEEDIFKSRLTAMAIETKYFKREDVYTLFITTRIINFLKGLSQAEKVDFSKIPSSTKFADRRSELGLEILHRLFFEKRLCVYDRACFIENKKFKTTLFFKIWDRLNAVQAL